MIQYWDPDIEDWVPIDSQVNTQSKTVSFAVDHFSRYCMVSVEDAGTPYARIVKISNLKMMDLDTAEAIIEEYIQQGEAGSRAQIEGLTILSNLVNVGSSIGEIATFESA